MPDPIKKDKPKDAAADASGAATPPKKSKGMLIGLIVGGVLLLTCCCTGIIGGGGAWWYFGSQGNKSAIVGTWYSGNKLISWEFKSDGKLKRSGFDLVYTFVNADTIEIKGDKGGTNMLNGKPYPTIRYQVTITGGNTLTLREVSPPPPNSGPEEFILKRG
jgi:hypothetical protein